MNMKQIFATLAVSLVFCAGSFAQSAQKLPSLSFDHYALYVKDMNVSAEFYMRALGLKEMDCPIKDGRHRWFYLGNGQELHIIQGDNSKIQMEKNMHICLHTTDIKPYMKHLNEAGIPFESWQGKPGESNVRIDGASQIYIVDPDGYWVEINDANTK
jgi:lactoylglutathione lyase